MREARPPQSVQDWERRQLRARVPHDSGGKRLHFHGVPEEVNGDDVRLVGSGRCDSPKINSRSTTPHAETAMLRDDNGNGGGRPSTPRNVLGERLEVCSISPMTGFFRDGCCDTGREDIGSHTVCSVMTAAFLEFSKSRGNDLSTPMPEFGFRGLKPGDRWCLCAPRWQEALEAGQAPRVVLRATHEGALGHCSLADLKRLAVDLA